MESSRQYLLLQTDVHRKQSLGARVTSFHLDGKEQTEVSHNYYKRLSFFKELISLREKKFSFPLPFNKGFGLSWDTNFLIDLFSLPLILLIIWCVLNRWLLAYAVGACENGARYGDTLDSLVHSVLSCACYATGHPDSQEPTGTQIIGICMGIYRKIDQTVKMHINSL